MDIAHYMIVTRKGSDNRFDSALDLGCVTAEVAGNKLRQHIEGWERRRFRAPRAYTFPRKIQLVRLTDPDAEHVIE